MNDARAESKMEQMSFVLTFVDKERIGKIFRIDASF